MGTKNWIEGAIMATKNWITGAIKKPLDVEKGEDINPPKRANAQKAPGKLGQRARLASTLKKLKP